MGLPKEKVLTKLLAPSFVQTLHWRNYKSVREGGIAGTAGDVPVFRDERRYQML